MLTRSVPAMLMVAFAMFGIAPYFIALVQSSCRASATLTATFTHRGLTDTKAFPVTCS